jgi:histidine triad (HIT) family protein
MLLHAPPNYICPFCLLVGGIENEHVYSVSSDIIYQDDVVTAFVSSHQFPNNAGNVLVIPNRHFENLYEFPTALAVELHRVIRAVALAEKAAFACDGISTRQHNEPAGNQDVWHYHVHVTPRYTDDGLYASRRSLMPADQRAQYAAEIRARFVVDW